MKAAVFECDGEVRRVNQPDSGLLTGDIFTDGSALWPLFLELRVAGWACVQVDVSGSLVAAVFGNVPRAVAPLQQARDG